MSRPMYDPYGTTCTTPANDSARAWWLADLAQRRAELCIECQGHGSRLTLTGPNSTHQPCQSCNATGRRPRFVA